jgi:hypothetical protein
MDEMIVVLTTNPAGMWTATAQTCRYFPLFAHPALSLGSLPYPRNGWFVLRPGMTITPFCDITFEVVRTGCTLPPDGTNS